MLKCLDAKVKAFSKNEIIIMTEDNISHIGIILSGKAQVERVDFIGNKNIVTMLTEGDLFAEALVCAGIKKSPVTVETVTGCEVMFIDYNRIITTCSVSCQFHLKLIENMIKVIAEKNIMLNQKLELVSKRTTRDKLLAYLFFQAQNQKSDKFEIPFTRNELADFLCVDRSAMSRELSRLRDDGVIKFHKNTFEISVKH